MFLGMDIYSWIAAIVIALIVTFLPITLPFKIVLAMVAMACFYFGRKYYHNHKNGGAKMPSMSSAESEALASGILKALGGKDNIVKVDYCATRLRFEVHSYASVDEAAAKALAAISGCTAAVSTPCAEDLCIAHYEVVQVGRSAAAVLAVTTAGYVRTRVARVRTGLSRENAAALAALLNRNLTFVAPVDLSTRMLSELCGQIAPELVPVVSAAAAILQDSVKPHVFLGGEQYLLDWPQLDGRVGDILTLLNDEEQAANLIAPPENRSESVLLGEDLEPQIPGLCIVSDRYLVGGGLWGSIALIGPTRMPFQKLMPLLHEFADQLGEGMSGKRKDTPQAAVPRRTVIYKEDLE